MGIFGAGSNFIGGLIAGKPDMPQLDKLSLADMQGKSVESNLAVLPKAEKLASGVNKFNYDQLQKMYEQSIPGFQDMKATGSDAIEKMLKGELPLSDINASQLSSVAKSFGTGTAGSGSMGNLVARDLGLKELDVISKGLSSAESWMGNLAKLQTPNQFDITSMFVNPMQTYGVTNEQNLQQFQHDWSKNLMDWQTSPAYLGGQAIAEFGGGLDQMAGSVMGAAGGAAAGGGGL